MFESNAFYDTFCFFVRFFFIFLSSTKFLGTIGTVELCLG